MNICEEIDIEVGQGWYGWMDGVRKELRGMGMTLEQGRQNSLNRRECAAIVKIGVALGPSIHASKYIMGTMRRLTPI